MRVDKVRWRGWESMEVSSSLLRVNIVPELGGRIMNFQLGGHAFLWTNPMLHGVQPQPERVGANGGWLNWGGDKVWLAPQGWASDDEWPGPPDRVLDGGSYDIEVLEAERGKACLRLTSQRDRRSGVQLSRIVSMEEGSSRLRIVSTMTNVGERVRRWGVWPVTQIDAASRSGSGRNDKLRACVPLNPASIHRLGYRVMYGSESNPQYEVNDGVIEVRYQHQVGKIGVDCNAGWVATIDGETGYVLVQQMVFDADAVYPDDASVEVWTNGRGTLTAYGRTETMPDDVESNPYMLECELVSPFAQLAPGESFDFAYSWAAANIGADGIESLRIRNCTAVGCEVEAFALSRRGEMAGRFGVFYEGECRIEFVDDEGRRVGAPWWVAKVSPLTPFVLSGRLVVPEGARDAVLALYGADRLSGSAGEGRRIGELGRVAF